MKIHLVLPYPDVSRKMHVWATEERTINFRKEFDRATRCTVCYAGVELYDYLRKMGADVTYSDMIDEKSFNIILAPAGNTKEEIFWLEPVENGVKIISEGRVGILYGAYEILRLQGVRWLNPDHDILPKEPLSKLNLPDEKTEYKSDMDFGRGFEFEGLLKESTKLWKWMVRNRLNLAGARANSVAFQKKLGFKLKLGGHIFERILDPDIITETGKTLWEEHNDWYGFDPGKERTKENALSTQFCVSSESLIKYLADELIYRLNHEWYDADIADLWIFDTWGSSCHCEKCQKLGNGSDRTLHFAAELRKHINTAIKEGRLDHDVGMGLNAYEGTANIEPPENPIPEILKTSGDLIAFAPILRCYKHTIKEGGCTKNDEYKEYLENWPNVLMSINEYYNVSKFEDLPLVFMDSMQKDFEFYHKNGVTSMTYMHLPLVEWGMRNLTQVMFAELCRDVNADVGKIIETYFCDRYENQAYLAKKAYDLCQQASVYASSWRCWDNNCALSILRNWNGKKPEVEFQQEVHFEGKVIEIGEEAIKLYDEAFEIMKKARRERELDALKYIPEKFIIPVNPGQMRFAKKDQIVTHIDEDIRIFGYGRDVMKLTVLFIKYYNALFEGKDSDGLWAQIQEVSEDLAGRYMPMNYVNSEDNIELECKDMFERSQLRELYYRCLKVREGR